MPRCLYSASDLADIAGLTSQTIYMWQKEGLIKAAFQTVKGRHLFDEAQLKRVLTAKKLREQGYSIQEVKARLGEAVPND